MEVQFCYGTVIELASDTNFIQQSASTIGGRNIINCSAYLKRLCENIFKANLVCHLDVMKLGKLS